MKTAGYSKTPLGRKLGIKEGFRAMLYNPPKHYFDLFADWPDDVELVEKARTEQIDFMQFFCTRMTELEKVLGNYKDSLKKNGLLWISWPKGTSKIETDLNRDIIRDYILKTTGLVDVKVAAIDQDWSGLKFVYRLENRQTIH